ncbi:hypothetical protein VTK56DRAFT_3844 [Thermocarpiscus australiensis]
MCYSERVGASKALVSYLTPSVCDLAAPGNHNGPQRCKVANQARTFPANYTVALPSPRLLLYCVELQLLTDTEAWLRYGKNVPGQRLSFGQRQFIYIYPAAP